MSEERLRFLRSRIRDVADFPKEGIVFKDITPLLADVEAFRTSIQLMVEGLEGETINGAAEREGRSPAPFTLEYAE